MPGPPDPAGDQGPDREAELLGAAATGDLGADETAAYDALVAADPARAEEVRDLRAVLERLGSLPGWEEPVTDTGPGPRVPVTADDDVASLPSLRRTARRLLPAAAALVLLGGLSGAGLALALSGDDAPPQGPPGTLGAVEQIDFQQEPGGVDIEAALVAHTWGTETVLTMEGFAPGDRYAVVLLGADGSLQESGTFLGSSVPIDCRLNAALLREDVAAVQIRDDQGSVVASSEVAAVPG